MGYRNYIIAVDKFKYNTIRLMNKEEFLQRFSPYDGYVTYFDIVDSCDGEEVYEIGKYMDWRKEIESFLEDFSTDKEVNTMLNDDSQEIYVARPEILKAMLTHYKNTLINYYKTLEFQENETSEKREKRIKELEQNARSHITWFRYMDEIPKNKWKINDSWLVEQEVLNLAHAIKIFDKDKYTLLFVGG